MITHIQIKHIESPYFQITMTEVDGGYTVNYTILGTDYETPPVSDYSLAEFIFASKLEELEGH